MIFRFLNQIVHLPIIYYMYMCFEIEMDMPIRIKRSFFYFKLNVIVKIRFLAKFDNCTILTQRINDTYLLFRRSG